MIHSLRFIPRLRGHRTLSAVPAGLCGLALMLPGFAPAYPPAPYHTLYGQVRNQWGDPLTVSPSDVFLETSAGVQLHTSVVTGLEPGVNYRLEVPMDSGTAPDLYQPSAMRPFFPYRLKVLIGQTVYLPIEMSGNFSQIGQPGQRTRLDLTLGVDSDGDGLPDAWEQALIDIYGGTLASITPNGDLDGDGISNLNEYIAGTYAFDPTDGFNLQLVGQTSTASALEFLAIRGRTYTIESSVDLKRWTPASFRLPTDAVGAALRANYLATDVRTVRVEVPFQTGGETNRYFKARVQ